ncbi:MAG TPA: NAD-dependent epimerase [Acidimicrobiaceae bacterium]|jgi:NAD(P)-dependent dehydrogenase (short-subunit alcohol dehydrogenase family)|nr:NAD-dependent epimerase [Acidimicrobiaceae bacterium]
MSSQRTIVITGSASGMGAATVQRLRRGGARVIGIDLRDAEVIADLSSSDGREVAMSAVREIAEGGIHGIVTFAGIAGLTGLPGSDLVSTNYFGTVRILEGLRPLCERGAPAAAVVVSSNSTTIQPGIPAELIQSCLADDEVAARALGDTLGPLVAYPATKTAVAWWARRHATKPSWAGSGINLNVVAPGVVETPMLQACRDDSFLGEHIDAVPVPVGGPASPDQLAAVVEFLLSPEARFLCGSVLFADGGTDALLRPDDVPVPWVL